MLKNMNLPYFQADWKALDPLPSTVFVFPDNVLFTLTTHALGTNFKSLTTKDSYPELRNNSVINAPPCMHKIPSIKGKKGGKEEGGKGHRSLA